MTAAEKKYIEMTSAPIRGVIIRLAVPMMICMLITSFYNIADTFFVGHLGKTATGAVGVAAPVMLIINAFGYTFGNGGGNVLANHLGRQDNKSASRAATTAFYSCFVSVAVIAALGFLFRNPLVYLLGATDTIAPLSASYLQIIFIGAPIQACSAVMLNIMRYQGTASKAMAGSLTGGILNIILDPIFIIGLGLGVRGAAIATVISQCCSFTLLLVLCLRTGIVSLAPRYFYFNIRLYLDILRLGLPTFLRQVFTSIAGILINQAANPYGDETIAAVTITSKVTMFFISSMMGFGQGLQPFTGYNLGAKKYSRIYGGLMFGIRVVFISLIFISGAGFIFSSTLVGLFTNDSDVIALASRAVRYAFPIQPIIAVVMCTDMVFQSMGDVKRVCILSVLRQGALLGAAAIVLPILLGQTGVFLVQPTAETISFFIAMLLFVPGLKKLHATPDGAELRRK